MVKIIIIFITFILYSPLAYAQGQWGILSCSADKQVVYSFAKLGENTKFKAYRVDTLSDSINIALSDAIYNSNSPIYSMVGSNSSWEHHIKNPKIIPHGSIWLCIPVSWRFHKNNGNEASFTTAKGLKGSIAIINQSEGIEINVCLNGNIESIYYYLGYDIK